MGLEVASFVSGLNALNPVGGTDPKSQGDDHLRLIKSVLLATFPGAVGALKFESTDAGAASGPTIILHRNSASPAAADIIGGLSLMGEDSASNETLYGFIYARIDDPTNGSEDSSIGLQVLRAGSFVSALVATSTGVTIDGTLSTGTGTLATGNQTVTGTITATSSITTGGNLTAVQNFISSTNVALLCLNSAGTIVLRPRAIGDTSQDFSIDSAGNTFINGTLTVTG